MSRRILIVDDYPNAAERLARFLKRSGDEVQTANDGLHGIAVAEKFRPEFVLIDIGLPDLNGHEVAERIRKRPWGREMVLIAVTGWAQDEDRQRSREAGFDAHLAKPVSTGDLAKVLASFSRKDGAS
jgi:CheY-like chemotaxis protein